MHLTNEQFSALLVVLFYGCRNAEPVGTDKQAWSQIGSLRFSRLIVHSLSTNFFALRRLPFGVLR